MIGRAPRSCLMVLLGLLAHPSVWQRAAGSSQKSNCFRAIVKKPGWAIPDHTNVIGSGAFRGAGSPEGITFTRFRVRKPFWLPRHFIEEERLVLFDILCATDSIDRLEVNGVPFAFVATVKGVHVGVAADVWWLDRDGDARFEEFEWGPDFSRIPSWVQRRLNE